MSPLSLLPNGDPAARGPRLIAFPYAGGGTVIYHRWREQLRSQVDVWPVRLPGRETRIGEPPFQRLTDLVSAAADQLACLADQPYVFCGHSMGGRVAFAVAGEMIRRDLPPPQLLIVSATMPPHLPPRGTPVHELPDKELIEQMTQRYAAIPSAVTQQPELLRLMLPMLRADMRVMETAGQEAGPPLPIDLLVLGGTTDATVNLVELQAWRQHTRGRFSLKLLPGGHFFLFESPGEEAALRLVAERLTECFGSTRPAAGEDDR